MRDIIRRCVFRPYRKGLGPTFSLVVWDTGRPVVGSMGSKLLLGYQLRYHEAGKSHVVFEGEDFGSSPLHAIDSDETVLSLMTFLTLRPGDTDAEYFADYTDAQRDFADSYAEALACEVESRFGGGQ